MKLFLKIACSALIFGAAPAAMAQDKPIALEGDVHAVIESVDADGNTQVELVKPGTIIPGDRLVFGTSYSNTGVEPVENFVMTNPLPAAVRLAPDADPALSVSVDGGKTFGLLADLAVTDAEGAPRSAAHSDVTHIRWTLDRVEPGESGRLEYPAIIR